MGCDWYFRLGRNRNKWCSILLVALFSWLALASCSPQTASVQILSIVDSETGQAIAANIRVRQADIEPGEDGQIF